MLCIEVERSRRQKWQRTNFIRIDAPCSYELYHTTATTHSSLNEHTREICFYHRKTHRTKNNGHKNFPLKIIIHKISIVIHIRILHKLAAVRTIERILKLLCCALRTKAIGERGKKVDERWKWTAEYALVCVSECFCIWSHFILTHMIWIYILMASHCTRCFQFVWFGFDVHRQFIPLRFWQRI